MTRARLLAAVLVVMACEEATPPARPDLGVDVGAAGDAGPVDAASDAATDAGGLDGADAATDAGSDTGSPDVGGADAATLDAATADGGAADAATLDAAPADDAAATDATPTDAATGDAGAPDGGSADAGGCDPGAVTPPAVCTNPLVPDSPEADWEKGTSAVVAIGGEKHRCIDLVQNPGQATTLIGKFAYGALDVDLTEERVEVWMRDATCTWTKLGSALTSQNGQYGTIDGVEDDGGRIFFQLAAGAPTAPGTYDVAMLVKGDHTAATCRLFVWPAGTRAVVSDIDGTITTREIDGFTTLFDPSSPTPHPSARDTFAAWASKGRKIVYLTARPEMFTTGTRNWFQDQGFPIGVLHLSQSNIGEFGAGAVDYKGGYLTGLVAGQGVVLEAAYGNKDTDLDAYLSAGLPPSEIRLFAYDGDLKGAIRHDDYGPEAARVSCLAPLP